MSCGDTSLRSCNGRLTRGFRSDQPVTAQVILSLGKQKPPVNHPSLPHKELGDALAKIRDFDGWWAVKVCIIFMAFTCVRSGEARMATWDEVDWDNATWTIPAARMKNHIKHKVPLSAQAMEGAGLCLETDRWARHNLPS